MKLSFAMSLLVLNLSIWASDSINYYKCYSMIVGEPPHIFLNKKTSDCLALLDQVSIGEDGLLRRPDETSIKILNNLNGLHKSWLLIDEIRNVMNSTSYDSTKDFYDSSESSLFITNVVFSVKSKFHEIVTSNYNLKAIREGVRGRSPFSQRNFRKDSIFAGTNCIKNKTSCDPLWGGQGKIIGIRREKQRKRNYIFKNQGELKTGVVEFGKHFGAGMIGSQHYLLANIVENYGYHASGLVESGRVWSTAMLNDILCRHLPMLKSGDYKSVQRYIAKDTPLIRSDKKCINCHATIDQLAGAIRNFHFKKPPTEGKKIKKFNGPVLAEFYPVDKRYHHSAWKMEASETFHLSEGTGRLFYRDSNDVLVDKAFSNLKDLGNILKDQSDFYGCYVRRYYDYFSGEKVARARVDKMANLLRKKQSLKYVIKEIIKDVLKNE